MINYFLLASNTNFSHLFLRQLQKVLNVCLGRQPLTVLFKVQPPTRRTSSLSTEY